MPRTRTKRGRKVSSSRLHGRQTSEYGADILKCVQVDLHVLMWICVGAVGIPLGCVAASCCTAIWDTMGEVVLFEAGLLAHL